MDQQAYDLIESIKEKYGEWLEMEGSRAPELLNEILACLLIKERSDVEYYKNLIRYYENKKSATCERSETFI